MFDTNDTIRRDPKPTTSDHGALQRGIVLSRGPPDPERSPTSLVFADEEPRITVEPESGTAPAEVVVPQDYRMATGVPTIGATVYFLRTTNDRGVLLGVAGDTHAEYEDERRIVHPHSNAHVVFNDDGTITAVADDGTTINTEDGTITAVAKDGTTVDIADGTVSIDGGTTPVITDVSASATTTTDADGHVTSVSVSTDLTTDDSVQL